MAVPTFAELKNWAENYVRLWNASDRDAWARNWRAVAPGDFTMLDPVGTAPKHGFEECALASFDLFQPRVRFRIHPGTPADFMQYWRQSSALDVDFYRGEPF